MEEHLRQLIRGIESLRGWTELRNMKGELAKKGTWCYCLGRGWKTDEEVMDRVHRCSLLELLRCS